MLTEIDGVKTNGCETSWAHGTNEFSHNTNTLERREGEILKMSVPDNLG
jgi:hypothetical protein